MDAQTRDDREELGSDGAAAGSCEDRPDTFFRRVRTTALVGVVLALGQGQASAADLVEFTFGTGSGTDLAQNVAGHLQVTPVVGRDAYGNPAPYSYVDLGGGNMAMQLLRRDGGYRFDFTITVDPGYSFQITDAHFAFRTRDTAGVGRDISVWPNADPRVTWYNAAGGDTIFGDMGPGGFGWKTADWNSFATRSDLHTLRVQLSLNGNSLNSKAIFDRVLLEGNVLAVPEPAAYLLLLSGLGLLSLAARRRVWSGYFSDIRCHSLLS